MSNWLKQAIALWLSGFIPVVILLCVILMAMDAYEFETTGKCEQCIILKQWFEMRGRQ